MAGEMSIDKIIDEDISKIRQARMLAKGIN